MLTTNKIIAGISILAAVVCSCAAEPLHEDPRGCSAISQTAAVTIAERFVRMNGYTVEPGDPAAFQYEFTNLGSPAETLALRHGQLEPKAYGVFDATKRPKPFSLTCWGVVFKHTPTSVVAKSSPQAIDTYGRVVLVNKEGVAEMYHPEVYLKNIDARVDDKHVGAEH